MADLTQPPSSFPLVPAIVLGALVAGCVWCCTREPGERTHPATMYANFKRGVKRVRREFRMNPAPQDDFSYAYSRARNQLVDHGMSRRQAVRLLDKALAELAPDGSGSASGITGKQLAEKAYEIRDRDIPGSLPPKAQFVMNGRGAKRRCSARPRRCPHDVPGAVKWLAEQMCVPHAKAKSLLKRYGKTRAGKVDLGAVEHIYETYTQFGEAGLRGVYKRKGKGKQRRNGTEDDPSVVAQPGYGPPAVFTRSAYGDPMKRSGGAFKPTGTPPPPPPPRSLEDRWSQGYDPAKAEYVDERTRKEREQVRRLRLRDYGDDAKEFYREDEWDRIKRSGKMAPNKRRRAGTADNRFHDGISDYWGRGGSPSKHRGQWLSGTRWRIERTPDGGSVTTQTDSRGRVMKRTRLSAKQYRQKSKSVRASMGKRSAGAISILVRQGVDRKTATRAVNLIGADSSDSAGELASRARSYLTGGARRRNRGRR